MAKSELIHTGVGMLPDMPAITVPSDGKLSGTQLGYIIDAVRGLIRTINGKLTLGDGLHSSQAGNFHGQIKEVLFVNANTDYEVPHGLGRVPIGLLQLDVNQDGAVLRGGSRGSWSPTRLFVRCNVADTTGLFVVV